MRIREPSYSAPSAKFELSPSEQSKTYEVTTITPIFGGGVEAGVPDTEVPVRASAIRGQLRYWWRFLASHRPDNPITDTQELFKAEREIWGGMGEKGEDYASKVNVQIKLTSKPNRQACYEYTPNGIDNRGKTKYNENFLHDIPAYALFCGKGKKPPERSNPLKLSDKESEVILSGLKFTITVAAINTTFSDTCWSSVLESLRWWANFGGIGARTRRGLGSIAVLDIQPLIKEDIEKYDCKLALLNQTTSASSAWNKSIQKLQSFRQGKGLGRRVGRDSLNLMKLGRSYWPEPDSIRLITGNTAHGNHDPINKSGTFPRAAFGLPIIFDFNAGSNADEPDKTELTPEGATRERMASPVILKAQYIGKKQFLPIALLLPTGHLNDLKVTLKFTESRSTDLPKTLARQSSDIWWPIEKDKQAKLASKIEPLKKRGNDSLTAFMHYFGGKNA